MNPLLEIAIVGLLVLGAAVYAIRHLFCARREKDAGCDTCGRKGRVKAP